MKILAKGESMLPNMHDGQYYEVEFCNAGNYLKGDVIAFCCREIVICHRVVKIIRSRNGSCFYFTKGDNNEEIDDFAVTEDMILGKIKLGKE